MSNWTWKQRGVPRAKATPITIASIALLLMLALVGGRGSGVLAQLTPVASPEASPTTGECIAPENGGDVGVSAGTPELTGTPPDVRNVEESAVDIGATPDAVELLVGTPVDPSVEEAVLAASQNFIVCYNAGEFETLVQLVTPELLFDLYGIEDPSVAVEALQAMDLPPITLLGVGEVERFENGLIALDVQYLLGEYQVISATHYFTETDGQYLFHAEEYNAPQIVGDSVLIGINFSDETDAISFDQGADELGNRAIPPAPIVNVFATNGSADQQIFELYSVIGEGESTPVAGELPDDAELVGRLALGPEQAATMALVNLPVGAYGLLVAGETATSAILFVAPAPAG
ncbi:MAG TPA: hypothetical protein VGR16_04030 [Thermomicrobiales bacterium]|nr:hypothetical protein [Thermomicrobiales bacterium]